MFTVSLNIYYSSCHTFNVLTINFMLPLMDCNFNLAHILFSVPMFGRPCRLAKLLVTNMMSLRKVKLSPGSQHICTNHMLTIERLRVPVSCEWDRRHWRTKLFNTQLVIQIHNMICNTKTEWHSCTGYNDYCLKSSVLIFKFQVMTSYCLRTICVLN